jgi:RNA polymerase sigma factor (TIGR02999 family)
VSTLTALIARVQAGDAGARETLFAAAYADLRRLARARLRDSGQRELLDTSALVHESYLRFLSAGALQACDRRAFFGYASQVMRSVIVDTVRERLAERRGGDVEHLELSTRLAASVAGDEASILRVHEALAVLAQADERLSKVVEMRYFGGYTDQEIAETLDVAERTVQRDWKKARLILAAALS